MTDAHSLQALSDRLEALRRGQVAGIVCNGCGKNDVECQKMIALPVGFICSECVVACARIIAGPADGRAQEPLPPDPPDAAQIRLRLFDITRGWISGQHDMSDWLAIADAAALWVIHGRHHRPSTPTPEAAA